MSVEKIKKLAADLGVTLADLSKAISEVADEEKKIYVPREGELAFCKTEQGQGFFLCIYNNEHTDYPKLTWKPIEKSNHIDMIGRTFAPPGAEWYAVDADGCMFWFDSEPEIETYCWASENNTLYKYIIYIGACDWKNSKGKVNP